MAGVVGQGLSIYEALRRSVASTRGPDPEPTKVLDPGDNGATPARAKETR
ncbi:MAG TPA: hypothetical protein VGP46_00190 [Acidimicrobiales bacterium]|nr:hypothetical protein [Acidimicrobiales bacterium]